MTSQEDLVDVGLHIEAGTLFANSTLPSASGVKVAMELPLAVVTKVSLPDGTCAVNYDQSTDMRLVDRDGRTANFQVPMPESKAARLVDAFRGLRPGHDMDCHDLVDEVEGWERDRVHNNISRGLFSNPAIITPGTTYAVMMRDDTSRNFDKTHSCWGTREQLLLGLLGQGSMMAVLDTQTALRFYPVGREAYLSQLYDPAVAGQYPHHIVPAKISHTL